MLHYTRKMAQVVTSLQKSFNKSVHKLSTSCIEWGRAGYEELLRQRFVAFRALHAGYIRRGIALVPGLLAQNDQTQPLTSPTGLRVLKKTFELRNELQNFATNFGIYSKKLAEIHCNKQATEISLSFILLRP